ncbi:hypothetical protein ACTMU2_10550 [Cupriavidus basilensis]
MDHRSLSTACRARGCRRARPVAHVRVADICGTDARRFLGKLLANDIGKLRSPGKALYSCMLDRDGGVIDDLVAYYT